MMDFEVPDRHVLTTSEVAEWLRYSPDQIRIMCEKGVFDGNPELGIGGAYRANGNGSAWRIPKAAVVLFLEQRRSRVRRKTPKP